MSCYEAPDGTLYYLHPEFVDVAEDASNPSMLFCDKCNAQIGVEKPKAPSHSLAAGVDFGVLSRIPEFCDSDMQLSEAEQMLLSDVRLYHIVTKARRDAAEILPRFCDAIQISHAASPPSPPPPSPPPPSPPPPSPRRLLRHHRLRRRHPRRDAAEILRCY